MSFVITVNNKVVEDI